MKTKTNVFISTLAAAVLGASAADDVLFVRKTMEFQLESRELRLVKEISGQSTTKKEAK